MALSSWRLNYGGATTSIEKCGVRGLAQFHQVHWLAVPLKMTAFIDSSYGSDNCSEVCRRSKMQDDCLDVSNKAFL